MHQAAEGMCETSDLKMVSLWIPVEATLEKDARIERHTGMNQASSGEMRGCTPSNNLSP